MPVRYAIVLAAEDTTIGRLLDFFQVAKENRRKYKCIFPYPITLLAKGEGEVMTSVKMQLLFAFQRNIIYIL